MSSTKSLTDADCRNIQQLKRLDKTPTQIAKELNLSGYKVEAFLKTSNPKTTLSARKIQIDVMDRVIEEMQAQRDIAYKEWCADAYRHQFGER